MTVNKKLLLDVLAKIEADPESWNQRYWFCGTAACFAGHACMIGSDATPDFDPDGYPEDPRADYLILPDGSLVYAGDHAQRLLGLSLEQRYILFDSANTITDLRRMVDDLVNDRDLFDPVHGFDPNLGGTP